MMSSAKRVGLLLFIAAIVLRAGWVGYCWQRSGAAFEFDDEALHWQLGRNLASHGNLVSDDGRLAARTPLYPLYLALFAGAGDWGVLAARLGQALLSAITVLVGYWLARAALGSRAALLAGILLCCDPFAVFFCNLLLTETLFTLVLIALIAAAWRSVADFEGGRSWSTDVAEALLGAAALLTRPSAAGVVALVLVAVWALGRRRRGAAVRLIVQAVIVLACLAPWGVRNYAVLGAPALLSTNGGATLYDAQGPQARGDSDQRFLKELPELTGLDEVQRDAALNRLAIEQMKRDPARVLQLAGVKLARTWNPFPNVEAYRGGAAAWVGAGYSILVYALALAGFWRILAQRRLLVLLALPVVYFALLHCVYVGSVRYRVPLMPLLAVACGAAVVRPDRVKKSPAGERAAHFSGSFGGGQKT